MRALQHQSQDTEWKIVAKMLTRVSHRRIVRTKNGENHLCVAERLKRTPFFVETIFCLAVIMGEISESRRNLGWNGSGVCLLYRQNPERFSGEILRWAEIRNRAS